MTKLATFAAAAALAAATSLHAGAAFATSLEVSPGSSYDSDFQNPSGNINRPSAGAMAFDLLAVRPLGVVSLVLGSAIFVLQLPFTAGIEDGIYDPYQSLVVTPAKFTFQRPLGVNE